MAADPAETIEIPAEVRANQAATLAPETAQQALQVAQSYVIDDDDMYAAAGEELRTIVTRSRQLEELRKSITAPMDEAKRRVMDFFRVPLERLQEAERVLKLGMGTYQREQAAKAEAARRAAEAAAERQRQEQQRLDNERRAAEAAAQAERDRLAADAQAKMQQAIDTGDAKTMAEAEQAMAAAASVQAALPEVPTQLPEMPAPTPVVPLVPRAAGVSTRTVWKARVVDKSAFIRAAAGRPEIEALLIVNEAALGQFAKATAGKAPLAGVTFYDEPVVAVRRRAS